MKRRSVFLLAACLILVGLPVLGESGTEQSLRAALKEYRQALVRKDVATLETVWTDDYTFINAHGRIRTKVERLAEIRSGSTSLDSIKHEEEPQVRVHGDVGLILSNVTIVGRYSGKEVSGLFRSTHIWIHDGKRWKLMMNQLTAVEK